VNDLTDITIILDRSGSMNCPFGNRKATIEGVNNFIAEQKKQPGKDLYTLIQFDDEYEYHWKQKDKETVPPLTEEVYVPRGSTALVDAVCRTIDETAERLDRMPAESRPSAVIIVIMTDGQENASRRYPYEYLEANPAVKAHGGLEEAKKLVMQERISHRRKPENGNWQFIFLAANQDAVMEACKYGIGAIQAANYTAGMAGTQQVMQKLSGGVASYKNAIRKSGGAGGQSCRGAAPQFEIDPDAGVVKDPSSEEEPNKGQP
jgi:hypothetical protein